MGKSGITSRSLNLKHISESSSPLQNKLSNEDTADPKRYESYKEWRYGDPGKWWADSVLNESKGKGYDPNRKAYRTMKRKDMAYDESNPYDSGRKLGNVLRDVIGKRRSDENEALGFHEQKPTTAGKLISDVREIGKNVGKKIGDTAKQLFPDKDTRHGKLTGEVYGKDSEFAGAGIREGGTIQERQKKFTQKRADRINSRIRSDNPDGGSFFGNKLRQIKSRLAADPSKSVQSKNQTVQNQKPNMNSGVEGTSLTKIPGAQQYYGNNISFGGQGGNRIFKDPVIETDFSTIKDSNNFLNKYKKNK